MSLMTRHPGQPCAANQEGPSYSPMGRHLEAQLRHESVGAQSNSDQWRGGACRRPQQHGAGMGMRFRTRTQEGMAVNRHGPGGGPRTTVEGGRPEPAHPTPSLCLQVCLTAPPAPPPSVSSLSVAPALPSLAQLGKPANKGGDSAHRARQPVEGLDVTLQHWKPHLWLQSLR